MNQQLNPKMIVLARESRGITQTELADRLQISQGKFSKIENGLARVSLHMMERLIHFLKYPKEFFYESLDIYPPGLFFYRKHKTLPQKAQTKIIADINIQRMHIQKLLTSAEVEYTSIPECNVDDYETPEEIARVVHHSLRLPHGPVDNITNILENARIIVIHRNVISRLFSAVSLPMEDGHHIIFVNKDMPGDRLRYTLAHELAHIVMHRIPSPLMEEEADSFAAELLMPEQAILPQLSNLSLEKLANLKRYWKVSMSALLKHSYKLGQLSERQYKSLWIEMGTRGYRLNEPRELSIPQEKPLLLMELIDLHRQKLEYTLKDLSQLVRLFLDEFIELYIPTQKHLRLVQ
jgi:Zn-dependent peptidase ImmA (M78 family)/transcriptional regulator with XRE-family HTH domain